MAQNTINTSALGQSMTQFNQLSGLILVTPLTVVGYQPKNENFNSLATPEDPIVFQYEGENSVQLESDVTDHYIEDNTTIQDHVALKPEQITVTGYVGELSDYIENNAYLAGLKQVAEKLTVLSVYEPQLASQAQLAYNMALYAVNSSFNAYNAVKQSINSLTNIDKPQNGQNFVSSNGISPASTQNKQQKMFSTFYGYYRNRRLFTVQTPWAVFDNCIIQSLRAVQDAESATVSSFEVTFKVLRFTKIQEPVSLAARLKAIAASVTNLGEVQLAPSEKNFSTVAGL